MICKKECLILTETACKTLKQCENMYSLLFVLHTYDTLKKDTSDIDIVLWGHTDSFIETVRQLPEVFGHL